MTLEQNLYSILVQKGEGLFGRYHIVSTQEDDDTTFRVYHSDGYCFEVVKTPTEDQEFTGVAYEYVFYCFPKEDGFKQINIADAIKIFNPK